MPQKKAARFAAVTMARSGTLPIAGEEPKGFTAICTTAESRRYDSGYAYDGSRMEPEWSGNEQFLQPDWAFSYKGGDKIEIGGSEYSALVFGPDQLREHPGVSIAGSVAAAIPR